MVSAVTGWGIDRLIEGITRAATAAERNMEILLPYGRGDLVSAAHERCTVVASEYLEDGIKMTLRVPGQYQQLFESFQK